VTQPTTDTQAVVRALDALTAQVERVANALTLTYDGTTDNAPPAAAGGPIPPGGNAEDCPRCGDDLPYPWICPGHPADDADALRTDRRDSTTTLLARLDRDGCLSTGETALLRRHIGAEVCESDILRAVLADHRVESRALRDKLKQARAERDAADRARAEAQRDRDQHAVTLAEVLRHFTEHGHPGEPCVRTGWIRTETVDRWRAVIAPTVERPWWKQLAEVRGELQQAQAAIERVQQACHGLPYEHARRILAALDGTEQPNTPETPSC
jgi:hypothetical protein